MTLPQRHVPPLAFPAFRRLNALSELSASAVDALTGAMKQQREVRFRHEILSEGVEIRQTMIVLRGWAARVRVLSDGRKAIVSFVLPGDLIGLCGHPRPLASSSVVALTAVSLCQAPEHELSASLARAYAVSRALDEAHLIAQVTRLSRLAGFERVIDLFLELMERLELAGLAGAGRFDFPLTQETVSDAVGLSPVHLNRMLQQARKMDVLEWSDRTVILHDPTALRQMIGRQPVRVTADE